MALPADGAVLADRQNPYVLDRNPCGSSSGSGAAVSANLTMFAIGTETNGSIVCPSNINGIVGLKPTVGLISHTGIIPISFTQDTPGPMCRTVEDVAISLGAMVGIDSTDRRTLSSAGKFLTDYTKFLKKTDSKESESVCLKMPWDTSIRLILLFILQLHICNHRGQK